MPLEQALQKVVDDFYGNLPHPQAPSVKAREYPAFARIAAMFKDAMPVGRDVEAAAHMLRQLNMAPAQFEYLWKIMRPVANRLTGQDPHPMELQRLQHAAPAEIHAYYAGLPHRQYPEVNNGEFARYQHAMTTITRASDAKRDPKPLEVARAAIAGWTHDDIAQFYSNRHG